MSVALRTPGWDIKRLGYRRAYDGVRALSIALVALTHGGASFRGGYIGLDMFFVLSGFLITSLLLEEWHLTGRIRSTRLLRASRKTATPCPCHGAGRRRSAPALTPGLDHGWSFVPRALVIIFYAGNWVVVMAGVRPLGALNQTWSLAVEEQFYIIWPARLRCLLSSSLAPEEHPAAPRRLRRRERRLARVPVRGAAQLDSVWPLRFLDVLAFRYPCRRAGAGLCACRGSRDVPRARAPREDVPLDTPCDRGVAVPSGGCGPDEHLLPLDVPRWLVSGESRNCVLARPHLRPRPRGCSTLARDRCPLVWIGRRSYGIYLIHLPIFFALSPARLPLSMWPRFTVRMGVTCLLAAAMFKWVETPFLRRKRYPRRTKHTSRSTVSRPRGRR